MYRIVSFIVVLLSGLSVASAQGGKTFNIAVGQAYRAGGQGGAPVALEVKSMVEYAAAREKSDTTAMSKQLASKQIIFLPQNSKIEILKIEAKSADYPHGLVECRSTTGMIKDGKIEQEVGTVYMIPQLFCQVFVEPFDEATRTAALPEDKPIYRTWKAATGNFEVDAELVKSDATTVTLKRLKDGKEIPVPLAQLSDADRKFLTDLAKETQSLLGTWRVVSIEVGGREEQPPGAISVIFAKDAFTIKLEGEPMEQKGVWKLNPAMNPKAIDMKDTMMGVSLGIYELKGDTLKICECYPDKKDRPTAFSSKDYLGGHHLMTLKRGK